jgi:hypothetical protein
MPKEGAGRTTSVSVMNHQGVGKMVSHRILFLMTSGFKGCLKGFDLTDWISWLDLSLTEWFLGFT